MFSIVRMRVHADKLCPLVDDKPAQFKRLHDATGELFARDGHYVSEPMSTTSAKYFLVEQCLRSLFGDPPHLFEDMTAGYKLLRTRAPQAYDYSYVIEIGTMPGEFGPERLVAIPKEHVAYQSGRYSSGMYTPIECVVYRPEPPMGPEHPIVLAGILAG